MNKFVNKIEIALNLAWRSLRLNILRTSLTVLGIVIGVAAIVVVFLAGDGISNLILGEVESYGINIIQTEIKVPSTNVSFSTGEITTLKLNDMEAINKLSNIEDSYAGSLGQEKIQYQNQSQIIFLFGISASYQYIDKKTALSEGYFFSESNDKSQSLVVVLGSKIKETLFADQSAVDKFVTIGNKKFRVIGVLEEQGGGFGFMDFNDMVYMPINTLHKRILGIDYAMYFIHQVKDVSIAEETALEIRHLMRERHNISNPDKEDFRVSTMAEMIDTLNIVTDAITFLLLAIVLISLLVGGVGIMNIMYVTVTERTPEIGLRKALGATDKDITYQFLIEAILITFWGWLIGVILGLAIAYVLTIIATSFGLKWEFVFPLQGVLVSLLFSISCGLLFGLRPAKQASRLDPIIALRQEQ
jgi:ABC-type antimicrobial peptide transport system permease subunit